MKMVRIAAVLIMWMALLAGSVLPANAQGTVTCAIDELTYDSFPEMRILFTVRDANGIPISDLDTGDFELVEDGRVSLSPDEVTTQVNPDAAISAMLVIDISGSMKGKPIEEAKKAANAFIDKLNEEDRAGIVAFTDRVDLDTDNLAAGKEVAFTTDKNALRNVIDLLDTKLGWDTPLYDAIYKGITLTAREPAGKRVLIVMTDGRDERDNAKKTPVANAGSTYAPDDPINEAARYGIPVFTIGVGTKVDTKYLTRLAGRTGGEFQNTPDSAQLTTLFQNVLDQLKEQYILGYTTGLKEDNSYHSLMVRVKAAQGQAFSDVKFWLGTDVTPTALVVSGAVPVTTAGRPQAQIPTALPAVATPEPTAEGFIEKVKTNVKDTIEDKPGLAAAIGGGALLLIILIVVLLVVLLRGRKGKEEMAAPLEFEAPAYSPPSDFGAAATGPQPSPYGQAGRPLGSMPAGPAAPAEGKTVGWGDAAPASWGEPAPRPGAGWPAPGVPQAPPPFVPVATPGAPPAEAGGTRIIERAPKHLAMLVNKNRPDQKHDLKGTMNVGRAPDNQLVIDHPTVSRHHAWVKEDKGEFLVFDIGSGNGTFVNEQRIEAPQLLQNGDVVRFGEVDFVFTKVF